MSSGLVKVIPAVRKSLQRIAQNHVLGYLFKFTFIEVLVFAALAIVTVLLVVVSAFLTGDSSTYSPLLLIPSMLSLLVMSGVVVFIQVALYRIALDITDQRIRSLPNLISYSLKRTPYMLALMLIFSIAWAVVFGGLVVVPAVLSKSFWGVFLGGLVALVVAIALMVRLVFSPFIMLERDAGPIEAIRESYELTRRQFTGLFLRLAGFFLLNLVAMIVAVILMFPIFMVWYLGSYTLINLYTVFVLLYYTELLDSLNSLRGKEIDNEATSSEMPA